MSPTADAVIVTTPAADGAVNVTALPDVLLVGEKPPPLVDPVELKDQVTPWFPVSFVSVAVIERVCEVASPPRFGLTVTLMFVAPAVTVIVDAAVLLPSAIEVAVSVIVAGLGAVAGAW